MAEHRGDRVLTDLVRDRGRALTSYAFLLTGDVAGAQDLVQDALVKVFVRTRSGFTPDVAEAYVRRTILTLYVDGFRRREHLTSLQHLVASRETGDGPECTAPDRIDLRAALGSLAPQERAAVVLRFYEDLTVPQIAEQMQLSPGTVKRYLSNAVGKLETRLGPLPTLDIRSTEDAAVVPLASVMRRAGRSAPATNRSGS